MATSLYELSVSTFRQTMKAVGGFLEAAWHHSVWGLETVNVLAPPTLVGPLAFAALRAMIRRAETALEALIPDEVNS